VNREPKGDQIAGSKKAEVKERKTGNGRTGINSDLVKEGH